MYYGAPFNIKEPVGNNAFGQPYRAGRSLFVPKLIQGRFDDLEIGEEVVFEEVSDEGEIMSFYGLKNFIKTEFRGKRICIFDNHNHAFFFWCEALKEGIIGKGAELIHIDEHSDMRDADDFDDLDNLDEAFKFTNFVLNVGNYIKPAIRRGLIGNMISVQSEHDLDELTRKFSSGKKTVNAILNLDLDIFSEGMEYIDYEKKKKAILSAAEASDLITIATSPFFISQEKAIRICKDIFTS